jgi:hypothetical protein
MRNDPPWHQLTVPVPVCPVLDLASVVITPLTVYEQARKVDGVDVGHHTGQAHPARGQAPCHPHDPVPKVVDVTGHAPPSTDDEFGPPGSGHGLEVTDRGVGRVTAEGVLLGICRSKDPIAQQLHCQDASHSRQAQVLQTV